MDFKEKQFDGSYEISEVEIQNEEERFRGLLYFPPEKFNKPYPLIIYFHGFPQLFTLKEIVTDHQYLLEMGYAFLIFNFRGYRFSEGKISIKSQVSDSFKILEFVNLMSKKHYFNINEINIIAHDFGAYIALILTSKLEMINKLLLLSPILDLKKHIYNEDFITSLNYINQFLPGNIKGVENPKNFIEMTKEELKNVEFQIIESITNLKVNHLKLIVGKEDKITPITEVKRIMQHANIEPLIFIVSGMDHDCIEEAAYISFHTEVKSFFEKSEV